MTLIKSLDKALVIIEFLSHHPEGSALKDIAAATGYNKATIYRLLSTLENRQYIYQQKANQKYRLTIKFMHIGYGAVNSELIGKARPILQGLMNESGETVNMTSRENDSLVFQEKLEPKDAAFRTQAYVGKYSPMYCTAAGKCFLAFSEEKVQKDYWQRNKDIVQKLTANTITDEKDFFEELSQIKTQGFALDNEENEAGISCVAAPVLDNQKYPVYAISISTLTPRLHKIGIDNIAKQIKSTTQALEAVLFHHG